MTNTQREEIDVTYVVRFSVGSLFMLMAAFAAGWALCDIAEQLRMLLQTWIFNPVMPC